MCHLLYSLYYSKQSPTQKKHQEDHMWLEYLGRMEVVFIWDTTKLATPGGIFIPTLHPNYMLPQRETE